MMSYDITEKNSSQDVHRSKLAFCSRILLFIFLLHQYRGVTDSCSAHIQKLTDLQLLSNENSSVALLEFKFI